MSTAANSAIPTFTDERGIQLVACRSSYATPRILTPNETPRVAEARVSDTVIWKDSMDSTADSHTLPSLPSIPPSSQASMEVMHPHSEHSSSSTVQFEMLH